MTASHRSMQYGLSVGMCTISGGHGGSGFGGSTATGAGADTDAGAGGSGAAALAVADEVAFGAGFRSSRQPVTSRTDVSARQDTARRPTDDMHEPAFHQGLPPPLAPVRARAKLPCCEALGGRVDSFR